MGRTDTLAPGNVVAVRDEDWLVTSVDESSDGTVLNAERVEQLTIRRHRHSAEVIIALAARWRARNSRPQ